MTIAEYEAYITALDDVENRIVVIILKEIFLTSMGAFKNWNSCFSPHK